MYLKYLSKKVLLIALPFIVLGTIILVTGGFSLSDNVDPVSTPSFSDSASKYAHEGSGCQRP